jgi:carbohydrate binding protein with CBM5/12 domain
MTTSIRSAKLGFTVSLMATLFAFTAIGCGAGEVDDGQGAVENKLSVNCPAKTDPWTIGRAYKVGDLVSFQGGVFQCRQAHTPVDGWFPNIVPALWTPVQCSNGSPATPPPPPATQPPTTTPPPPPPANSQCQANGAPGPKFDPAGAKNVGNGHGGQFIGGQCLRAADCASGCCALPCGICSGPGAQFQAGKQGCGFGG